MNNAWEVHSFRSMTFPDAMVFLLTPNSQGQSKYKGHIWATKTSENCWRIKWKGWHFLFFMGLEDSKNRETSQTKPEEDRHARPIGCHLYLWNRETSQTKPEEDRHARPIGCHLYLWNREMSQTKLEEDRHARPIGCHLYLWNRETSQTKREEDRHARPAHWLSSLSASTAWGSGCGLQGDGSAALSCSKSWAGTNMVPSMFRAQSYKKQGPNKPLPIQKSLVLEESTDPSFTPSDP